jgi:hypothetical protein
MTAPKEERQTKCKIVIFVKNVTPLLEKRQIRQHETYI